MFPGILVKGKNRTHEEAVLLVNQYFRVARFFVLGLFLFIFFFLC